MANTANISQPEIFINYISQRKKIVVNDHNMPTQLLIQTDYYLNDTLYFKIINVNNQIVELDNNTTYQLYGTYIDAKKQLHILFYTLGVHPTDNTLEFIANTYTSQYLAYIKSNNTPINISIVAKQTVAGGGTKSYMVLRDSALANPRGYIEGQAPTDIVYQNIFNSTVPVSTAFGAGNDINLAQDPEGQEIYSFAFGDTLSTNNANQFVIGYNNTPDATKAFIVANSGNIFTVDYEGNVEAGDLIVGAISATSITISGEDLNQVIDDKVEYLSTSIDDKLSATENWVTSNFEDKMDAFNTHNALEAKIINLSANTNGKIDYISSFVSGLPQDISDLSTEVGEKFNTLTGQTNYLSGQIDLTNEAVGQLNNAMNEKASKEALLDLSGQVQDIPVVTKVSDLQQDIPYLSSITSADIPTSYVQEDQLADYATVASLTSYAEKSEIPVLSSSISAFLAEGDNIKLTVNDQTGVVTISGTAAGSGSEGKTYTGASGIVVDNDNDIIGISATNLVTTEQLGEELNAYTKTTDLADYISSNVLTGYATTSWVEEQEFATTSALSSASGTLLNSINGLDDDVDYLSTQIDLKADSVDLVNYAKESDLQIVSAAIPTSYVEQTEFASVCGVLSTAITGKANSSDLENYVETTTLNDYYTSSEVNVITGQLSTALVEELSGDNDTTYTSGRFISISGDANTINCTLTGLSQLENDSQYITLAQVPEGTVYGAGEGLKLQNATFSLTGTILTGGTNIEVSGKSINFTGTIPTTVAELTDASDYALVANLPTSYISSDDVSGIVEEMSTAIRTGLATTDDIPTTVAELTDSSNYALKTDLPTISTYVGGNLISVTSSDTNQYTIAFTGTIPSVEGLASETYVNNAIDALSDVFETTGNVATLCTALSTAITGKADSADIPTSNSELTNDAHYITSSDIPTSYVQKDEISAMATTGYVTGYCSAFITQADIPSTDITKVSQLVNDSQFITIASLADYAQISDIPDVSNLATKTELQDVAATIPNSGAIIDVATGAIPTKLSEFTDDTEFATSGNVETIIADTSATIINGLAKTSDLPTKISDLDNDSQFATSDYVNEVSANIVTGQITGLASDLSTLSTQVQGLPTQNTTYTDGNLISITGTNNSINFTGTIPTIASLSDAMYEAVSGDIEDQITGKGYVTTDTTYTAGTGIEIDENDNNKISVTGMVTNTEFSDLCGVFSAAINGKADSSAISTYVAGTGISITSTGTNEYTISAAIPTVPTNVSDFNNDAGYITNSALNGYAQTSYVNTVSANIVTGDIVNAINDLSAVISTDYATTGQVEYISSVVSAIPTYTVGTGLTSSDLGNHTVQFSLSAAGAGENKVLSSQNGTIVWADNVAGGSTVDVDTICGMLSSANENLTISKSDNKILFTATGGGGISNLSGGPGIKISQIGDTTVISIATAAIVAPASQTFNFDFRNGSEVSSVLFLEGTTASNVNATVFGTLPNCITTAAVPSGISFTSLSAASGMNTTGTVNVVFDALDAYNSVTVPVQISTIGRVSATIDATSAEYIFDGSVAGDVTSAFNYYYDGSEQLTVEISGDLPSGVTAVNSFNSATGSGTVTFTGNSSNYTAAYTATVNVVFSANDLALNTNTQVNVTLQNVETPVTEATPFTIKSNGSTTVTFDKVGTPNEASVDYSVNGGNWTAYTWGTGINLTDGQTVAFSGANTTFSREFNNAYTVKTSGDGTIEAYGNVNSLINWTNVLTGVFIRYLFEQLFFDNTKLVSVKKLILPFTVATPNIYQRMFCCKSWTGVYGNLTAAMDELPALTGADSCYSLMFRGQNKLQKAPHIKLTDSPRSAAYYMFTDCSQLNYIEVDFTDWNQNNYTTTSWLDNVAANGTFKKPAALSTSFGNNHIPNGWTVIDK